MAEQMTLEYVRAFREAYRFPKTTVPPRLRLARSDDPESSHEAAEAVVSSGRHGAQCQAVIDALRGRVVPVTSRELANAMGVGRDVTARRLPDLEKRGHVVRAGMRRCTVSGRRAVAWRVR